MINADGEAFRGENREKQHHVLVFAPTLDGVVDPSCRIISPTAIIIRPSSPLARLAFRTSDCASRYSLVSIVRNSRGKLMHMVEANLLGGW